MGLFDTLKKTFSDASQSKDKQFEEPNLENLKYIDKGSENAKWTITKETKERIKLGEERRTLLNNLGITYEPNDNRGISLLTDDEFNNLIKNFQKNGKILTKYEYLCLEYDRLEAAGLDHFVKNFQNKYPNIDKNSKEFKNLKELLGRKGYVYDDDMLDGLIAIGHSQFIYYDHRNKIMNNNPKSSDECIHIYLELGKVST